MPICPICDDTGLQNSDAANPEFCFCAAGKRARRQWETNRAQDKQGKGIPQAPSFIDIAHLEQVNASVDAMRASLLGSSTGTGETQAQTRHQSVQLLYRLAHPGHEITVGEATQLQDLAKTLEAFLTTLAPIRHRQQ